jgi:hypothetical protein
LAITQDSEEPAHLNECGTTGFCCAFHRVLRGVGLRVDGHGGSLTERHHYGERVRNDIVHLPRNPRSFFRCRELRALFPLASKLMRPIYQRCHVAPAVTEIDCKQEYDEQPEGICD